MTGQAVTVAETTAGACLRKEGKSFDSHSRMRGDSLIKTESPISLRSSPAKARPAKDLNGAHPGSAVSIPSVYFSPDRACPPTSSTLEDVEF